MPKTQIVLWIDDKLKEMLKLKYDNISKKFSEIMQIQLDIEQEELDHTKVEEIETKIILLKNKLKTIEQEQEHKTVTDYSDKLKKEKVNYPIIEKEFMDLLQKWEIETKEKFTNEWEQYLKGNNLMPNDCNRVQYWFRFYKSEGKTYE